LFFSNDFNTLPVIPVIPLKKINLVYMKKWAGWIQRVPKSTWTMKAKKGPRLHGEAGAFSVETRGKRLQLVGIRIKFIL
jgi:hypothetical protein